MNIPTPHIEVKEKGIIAKTVLMPGDPLRAKFIAENFLENAVQFNIVRNMFGYTGTYKGKELSVMGSGMGIPSMGIYSYELYEFYDVENIIRIGSCGAYSASLDIFDIILVDESWSQSSYAKVQRGYEGNIIKSTDSLNNIIKETASNLNIPVISGRVHTSEVFDPYRDKVEYYAEYRDKYECIAAEMEAFALFANAEYFGKNAACLATVSDSMVTKKETTSEERAKSFTKMMEIALEAAICIE